MKREKEGGTSSRRNGGFKRQIQDRTAIHLLSSPLPFSSPLAILSSSFTSLDICARVYAGEPVIPARGKSFGVSHHHPRTNGEGSCGGRETKGMEGDAAERDGVLDDGGTREREVSALGISETSLARA